MELIEIAANLGIVPEEVSAWGMALESKSVVARPRNREELAKVFAFASRHEVPLGFRGGGCSYGDASMNDGAVLVDLSGYDEILSFDEETGLLVAEPGVTLEKVWRSVIGKGWWPPVVSGTMAPTLGGLLAMNVHGKNDWKAGTIGEHVSSFKLMTLEGEEIECSPEENADVFRAAIGGFGMLGCFTEIRLRMKKIYSGRVSVDAVATRDLRHMICWFEENRDRYHYLVGWIDCFPKGKRLGRGLIHAANHFQEGEDSEGRASMSSEAQDLPSRLFGVIPKRWMWRFLKPFLNDLGMRMINAAKFHAGVRGQTRGIPYPQEHAAFNFLLDYVPDWKFSYRPGGLIQFQSFVPKETAAGVHTSLLETCHREGIYPYLGVYKRHRPDPFLLTHAVDGFSFAMDFRVTAENRERLWDMTRRMTDEVLEAGGRFYFAKDAVLLAEQAHRIWPEEDLAAFLEIKRRLDPRGLLRTDLSRRLFPEMAGPFPGPGEASDEERPREAGPAASSKGAD